MAVRWLAEIADENGLAVRVGREDDRFVAEWLGLARLVASRDGGAPSFTAEPGAPAEAIEKIRAGAAALLLRHLQGKIGLHGSAVALDGRAAVFVGASGQGKSTLAAWMSARAGAALVSDDAVALDREGDAWCAVPLERDHWLDGAARAAIGVDGPRDGLEAKRPRRAANAAEAPATLGLVALLSFAEEIDRPRLVPLRGVEAIAALVPLVVRFVLDDPAAQRRELDMLADLVGRVPIVRLDRPRGLSHLPATSDIVARALGEGDLAP